MANLKPLVAVNGKPQSLPEADNLTVPSNITLDYGNIIANNRALPGWGVPQRNTCAGALFTAAPASLGSSNSICWSPELGLFCSVGTQTNAWATSKDGITWTGYTGPVSASGAMNAVCWSPALKIFCAVGDDASATVIYTSTDGVTWTGRTSPASQRFQAVCWSPELNLFCAVGDNTTAGQLNRIATSPDGITWTARQAVSATSVWSGVCWSPQLSLFCACARSETTGTLNRIMTSPNGTTWTVRNTPVDRTWISICWSAERSIFCAVGHSTTVVAIRSVDGITWSQAQISAASTLAANNVCWAPSVGLFFTAIPNPGGNTVSTSPDAVTWTFRATPVTAARSGCWCPELGIYTTGSAYSLSTYKALYSETNGVYYPASITTATAANAFLDLASIPVNQILRSTSSARYKTQIEDLDATHADAVLGMRPVWYRSLSDADPEEWSFYGFIAEEAAEIEPRLVSYMPEPTEEDPNRLIPDGFQYDRLVVFLLHHLKQQRDTIAALKARVDSLKGGA